MDKEKILELNCVNKEYLLQDGITKYEVIKNLSFFVNKGDTVAILGPSGSGKSTLLNMIGALDKPTSGDIIFKGTNYKKHSEGELSLIRNSEIGFIFQMHHLFPQCTVLENILLPTLAYPKNNHEECKERALNFLKYVGLENRIHSYPSSLSGGELMRTAILRALINEPVMILADEPTGSLDQKMADDIANLFLKLNIEKKITVIVVTHSEILSKKMNKIYYLKDASLKEIK